MSKYRGERWVTKGGQMSKILFIVIHWLGHVGLRDLEEEKGESDFKKQEIDATYVEIPECGSASPFFRQSSEDNLLHPDWGQKPRLA